jgi:hypothetical protein
MVKDCYREAECGVAESLEAQLGGAQPLVSCEHSLQARELAPE